MKATYILGSILFTTGVAFGALVAEIDRPEPEPETIVEVQEKVVTERVEVPKIVTVHDVKVLDRQVETQLKEYEKELIARVVYAEGNNQDMIGKRLIVDTILNRVDNERFPNSVSSVIYQEHQFVKATSYNEECMMAVEMEMYERLDYDIFWFASTYFQPYGTPAYQHGDHYFSWEEL